MTVDKPTLQILVVWEGRRWTVSRNIVEVGAYAYRSHALEMARTIAEEAERADQACYMLIRDKEGAWTEHPCPRPSRSGRTSKL